MDAVNMISQVSAQTSYRSTFVEPGVTGDSFSQMLSLLSGEGGDNAALMSLLSGSSYDASLSMLDALNNNENVDIYEVLAEMLDNDDEENIGVMELIAQMLASEDTASNLMSTENMAWVMNGMSSLSGKSVNELMQAYFMQNGTVQQSTTEEEQFAQFLQSTQPVVEVISQDNTQSLSTGAENLDFMQSVYEAKRELESGGADAEIAVQTTSMAGTAATQSVTYDEISSESVTAQTLKAITTNLATSSDENQAFTVKLSPEGLGEILVKLEKTSDGLVLKMTATNLQTADMLNMSMQELRASLSAYNPQIEEVEVAQTHSASQFNSFSQQSYTNDRNNNGQNAHRNNTASSTRLQTYPSDNEVTKIEVLPGAILNTYI